MTPSPLMTARDVARVLGVRPERVYELVRRSILPSVKIGRQVRIAPAALDTYILTGGHRIDREDDQ